MEVGAMIGDIRIKLLMYADDIVILANDTSKLQRMIHALEKYTQKWNLNVNLDKSKIMIFQNGGGKRGASENWSYLGSPVEIVNRYKYLGIIVTPKLAMTDHLKERLNAAKCGINSTWNTFGRNKNIKHSTKFAVFNAVSKAVLCYGAEVWGFHQYNDVEKLLRFFLKKLFMLPRTTPNYALILETGISSMYINTLKLHFSYIYKVLHRYSENRLPKKLAKLILQKRIYWAEEWEELAEKHGIMFDFEKSKLLECVNHVIQMEKEWEWKNASEKARQTIRHGLYDKLNYNLEERGYFRDEFPADKISKILRLRCGLLMLNANPWTSFGSTLCSLCNLEEDEDLAHFLARCPMLTEFRLPAFGRRTLSDKELINILNGDDFEALFLYVKNAWKYRQLIIEESYT